ncbi:MAG: aldehyde dehydrogenase family protein [Planctomycetota bacterium]
MDVSDLDLRSMQEARQLVSRAKAAHEKYAGFTQERVDRICAAIAEAGYQAAEHLARLAVEESGFGTVAGKTQKNVFNTVDLWQSIKDFPTVGVVRRDEQRRVYEIVEPYGVVLAIVPITNPTSTALFKILISLKARNTIVVSPHPRGVRCVGESARICYEAALRAGAPEGVIGWMQQPTLQGTQEAMRHRATDLILATGGPDLVKAAYSAGKPAIGVGPGNCPAYIDRSADVPHAVRMLVLSKTFDNGTVCASEQSVVIDAPVKAAVMAEFARQRAHLLNEAERRLLERIVARGGRMNPDIVGQHPRRIAEMAGFSVPADTTVLLAEEAGVGPDHPLSIEKLCPLLTVYTVDGWQQGCERCFDVLNFGGRGHTLVIHAQDEKVIWEFGFKKPAHRILVNAPASQGSIGFGTGLVPSMTLGCGAYGNNILSDNISVHNLVLYKRLAWGYEGFWDRKLAGRPAIGIGTAHDQGALPPVQPVPAPAPPPAPCADPKPPAPKPGESASYQQRYSFLKREKHRF